MYHLLIPAYRRMYIEEQLVFDPNLCPLVLEGLIYDAIPFVSLKVINEQEKNTFRMTEVNNMSPDDLPSVWNLWNAFASKTQTLYLGAEDAEDVYENGDADCESGRTGDGSMNQPANARGGVPSTRNGGKATPCRKCTWLPDGELPLVRRRPRPDARVQSCHCQRHYANVNIYRELEAPMTFFHER